MTYRPLLGSGQRPGCPRLTGHADTGGIGAGVKGIAIAAKARGLTDAAFGPPRLALLERSAPTGAFLSMGPGVLGRSCRA